MRRLSGILLFCLLGCGSGGPAAQPLYPVTGTVLVGGKALADTTVQLIPADPASKAKPGIGKTDAEGKFTIRTNGDKGANVGKFKVVLGTPAPVASQSTYSLEEATKMSGQFSKTAGPPKAETPPFPTEWADAKTSPKEVDVVDKAVEVNIDI